MNALVEQHFVVLIGQGVLRSELVEVEVLRITQRPLSNPNGLARPQIDEGLGRGGFPHAQVLKTQPGTMRQPASRSRSRRR